MKYRGIRLACLAGLAMVGALLAPRDANAVLRWTSGGGNCQPWGSGYVYNQNGGGMTFPITDAGNNWAMCEIPMGTDLVQLAQSSSRTVATINVRGRNPSAVDKSIETFLAIYDYNSDSVCACDETTSSVTAGAWFNRNLSMSALGASCGGCAGTDFGNWSLVLSVFMEGSSGEGFTIKRIRAFDDN